MMKIGPVEKKIYSLREEHPLIIPQIDPEKYNTEKLIATSKKLENFNIRHVALGGSFVTPANLQNCLDILIKDFDFSIVTYVNNSASFTIKGKKGRTAIYWMTVFNANNLYYLRDCLIHGAALLDFYNIEPIPTAYVFDERFGNSSANWLTQPNLIPRNKPEISLAMAITCQYLGIRFYIMAGGSGSPKPPPINHISEIAKKTDLFLIPTSGITTRNQLYEILKAGADATHVGSLIENKGWERKLQLMINVSKKFPGKIFEKQ